MSKVTTMMICKFGYATFLKELTKTGVNQFLLNSDPKNTDEAGTC